MQPTPTTQTKQNPWLTSFNYLAQGKKQIVAGNLGNSQRLNKPFSGNSIFVHWYQTIAKRAVGAGAKEMGIKDIRSADILVFGGHHYGNSQVNGRVRPGRFERGGSVWKLHCAIGRKPITDSRLIMITGCNGMNGASMAYYSKWFPNALLFGSGMGVDPKTKAGTCIQDFWKWTQGQGLGKLDWKNNQAHKKLLSKKFEQFIELEGAKDPGQVAGMGWFDTRTGTRRIYIRDKRTRKGRWITQDYSRLLPKRSKHVPGRH